jgi:hypothetical protein
MTKPTGHTLTLGDAQALAAAMRERRVSALVADVRDWAPWKIRAAIWWLTFGRDDNFAEVIAHRQGLRSCRVCGCTNDFACDDGCYWVEADLCSTCVGLNRFPRISDIAMI